jgi:hypothetical protein
MAQLIKIGEDTAQAPGNTSGRIDLKLSRFAPIKAYLNQP